MRRSFIKLLGRVPVSTQAWFWNLCVGPSTGPCLHWCGGCFCCVFMIHLSPAMFLQLSSPSCPPFLTCFCLLCTVKCPHPYKAYWDVNWDCIASRQVWSSPHWLSQTFCTAHTVLPYSWGFHLLLPIIFIRFCVEVFHIFIRLFLGVWRLKFLKLISFSITLDIQYYNTTLYRISYYDIIDHILYAVLHIPVTIL